MRNVCEFYAKIKRDKLWGEKNKQTTSAGIFELVAQFFIHNVEEKNRANNQTKMAKGEMEIFVIEDFSGNSWGDLFSKVGILVNNWLKLKIKETSVWEKRREKGMNSKQVFCLFSVHVDALFETECKKGIYYDLL